MALCGCAPVCIDVQFWYQWSERLRDMLVYLCFLLLSKLPASGLVVLSCIHGCTDNFRSPAPPLLSRLICSCPTCRIRRVYGESMAVCAARILFRRCFLRFRHYSVSSYSYRTHTCGELGKDHVGNHVTLCGWTQKFRYGN